MTVKGTIHIEVTGKDNTEVYEKLNAYIRDEIVDWGEIIKWEPVYDDISDLEDLTEEQQVSLKKLLEVIEKDAYSGFKHYNGGFAEAEIYNCEDGIIDVELKFGMKDDTGSKVYSENLRIDVETMTVKN